MTMHLVSPAISSRHRLAYRSIPARLGALALAILFTASQIQAQGPIPRGTDQAQPAASSQSQQAATPAPATPSGLSAPAANPASAVSDNLKMDGSALPEAPSAPAETASVAKPLDIKAMMDDAAQATQNLQPTATEKKHQTHPGWLALTVVGALGATIGAMGLSKASTQGKPVAAGFVGVGAGLAGLGLYLTFK